MDKNSRSIMDIKLEKTRKNLEANFMKCSILNSKAEVLEFIDKELAADKSVAVGGSQTLFECGVIDHLRAMDIQFLDRYEKGLSREDIQQLFRESFSCDAYLCSVNALTMDGELVCVDGTGNRVASMIYGPKKVIVIVGENKLVVNEEAAYERIREIAAPMNNARLEKLNPCVKTGSCINCSASTRICSYFVSFKKQVQANRIHVCIVKEDLGY